MTLQIHSRQAELVPHIRMAAISALGSAIGAVTIVWLLTLIVPQRSFWIELTVVAILSASVAFRLQLTLCKRNDALRETRKELHYALRHDPVTGTLHANEFANSLDNAIDRRRVNRTENPDGVMLVLRVCDFDEIGRRYGLQWADTLMQSIVQIVHSSVRYGDLVARLASDELGIYLPGTTADNASGICERIRTRIKETTFTAAQERQIVVTVRLGGTRVSDQADFYALREAANRAALAAEEAGPLIFRELFS